MNPLQAEFARRRDRGERALLPFITAGDPDCDTTIEILTRIPPDSCACVELGIPFSDPIADGPVIQASFARALDSGFRVANLLDALRAAGRSIRVPLVAMVSYSIIHRRGVSPFVEQFAAAGVSGVLAPDLVIEEADDLRTAASNSGLSTIFIAAPTTEPDRLQRIAAASDPFVYLQSVAGITGERTGLPPELPAGVQRLRSAGARAVCIGFGISRPEHVRDVCRMADGAIVGSALIRRLNEAAARGERGPSLALQIEAAVRDLATGLTG
ncbi:MAG: tryptophan synthase subunit alpha [Phycisphaerales bacterium]|nr:tryptophan synthase subunit alpha [Phycisphaerales bacterium]